MKLATSGVIYGQDIAEIEGALRILWGLGPLVHSASPNNKYASYIKRIRNLLRTGTNPNSKNYFGKLTNYNQITVEMAPVALLLALNPWIIKDFSAISKNNLNKWLLQINDFNFSKNNWQFFKVIVNLSLRLNNLQYSQKAIEDAFENIEKCYLKDGWYFDGREPQRDYYIAFGYHFYGLVYAKFAESFDPKRAAELKKRALLFYKTYVQLFSEDGSSVPFGRSLTYRFAHTSFFSALVFAFKPHEINLSELKWLISQNLKWWMKQDIFDPSGVLNVGYAYQNLIMAEEYNSPTSPLWSFKTFLILAVKKDHPFWSVQPKMPKFKNLCLSKQSNQVLLHPRKNFTMILNGGQFAKFEPTHVEEKYAKFIYSNYFGFNVSVSNKNMKELAADNMLAVFDNKRYYVRSSTNVINVLDKQIEVTWSPFEGVEIITKIIPKDDGVIREHVIKSNIETHAYESGFAIPENKVYPYTNHKNTSSISYENNLAYSSITALTKNFDFAEVINCHPNVNVNFKRVFLPTIKFKIKKGLTKIKVFVAGYPKI